MGVLSFLDREHTVAKPGFSRWMVPPAALCVHLCIGQAYALSVFNLPMTKLLGISQSVPGDWKLTELGWIFSLAMLFLGGSAAVFGRWVEDGGPRRAMFTAGCLWAGGFFVPVSGGGIDGGSAIRTCSPAVLSKKTSLNQTFDQKWRIFEVGTCQAHLFQFDYF